MSSIHTVYSMRHLIDGPQRKDNTRSFDLPYVFLMSWFLAFLVFNKRNWKIQSWTIERENAALFFKPNISNVPCYTDVLCFSLYPYAKFETSFAFFNASAYQASSFTIRSTLTRNRLLFGSPFRPNFVWTAGNVTRDGKAIIPNSLRNGCTRAAARTPPKSPISIKHNSKLIFYRGNAEYPLNK